jgi:pimeloyl-ACP methyl ester carboxylesterase
VPHVHANGLRFHVQVLPDPPPAADPPRPKVVLIHGLIMDSLGSYYVTIANPLALVADTYLYDLRGHGLSDVPETGYAVADHVDDLRRLLDTWGIDEPVHLVSNSFGGVIALTFADLHPERVASLVLLEAHFGIEGWGEYMAGGLALAAFGLDEQRVKDWLAENGDRKLNRLARRSEHLFLRTSLIDDLGKEPPFPLRALRAIRCPTLAIYGEGSDILSRARLLEQHIPGCELHVLPGCTHSLLQEATPFVRQRTLDWVTRHHRPTESRGRLDGPAPVVEG